MNIKSILEFEKVVMTKSSNMLDLHSHQHYELYFLLEGTRQIFLENSFFEMNANTFIVFPPNCPHKTEGGAFTRINLNLPARLLTDSQKKFLNNISEKAIMLDERNRSLIVSLLNEACYIQSKHKNNAEIYLKPFAETIVTLILLQKHDFIKIEEQVKNSQHKNPVEILKVVHFINTNYNRPITLNMLSEKYFVSIPILCRTFKESTNYTIGEYLLKVRLDNAKFLLLNTNKSIDDIAEACGFSSANYFSLMFKRKIGISPLNYRKPR